jgi:hypothetical protein
MKKTLLLVTFIAATLLLFPSTAFAFPPDGQRLIYYSDSSLTVEVGRRYVCLNSIFHVGSTSSYRTGGVNSAYCLEYFTNY